MSKHQITRSALRNIWEVGSDMSGAISVLPNIAGIVIAAFPNASNHKTPIILLWVTSYLAMWVFAIRLMQKHAKKEGELREQIADLNKRLDRRDMLERQGLELSGCLKIMAALANEIAACNYRDFKGDVKSVFNDRVTNEINHTFQQIRIFSQTLAAWFTDQISAAPPATDFGMDCPTQFRDWAITRSALESKIEALKKIIYDF